MSLYQFEVVKYYGAMAKVSRVCWWYVRHFIVLLVITTWSGCCEKKAEIALQA